MKYATLTSALFAVLSTSTALADHKVYDEASLQAAIAAANADSNIHKIVFKRKARISLHAPVVYTGKQDVEFIGNNAVIDGSEAGSFVLDENLIATTDDGSVMFNTAGDISIRKLSVVNSATRGIVVNVPESATGDDINVSLHKVQVTDSALYGLHIDDNADEFDDGTSGSAIGIDLMITQSGFTGNGTGAIDFDGVRVDERAQGGIHALIIDTSIDANGGDGIELDEGGDGDVDATMMMSSVSHNGFFNEADLDDGFDIDEADAGNIEVRLFRVKLENNLDEGLDFDETGEGDIELELRRVQALDTANEGIKVDEEDAGSIEARLSGIRVAGSGDDGIQFTELGEGRIEATLNKVTANDNKKYGIKMEQWFIEDEPASIEDTGSLKIRKVSLNGNGKGDDIKLNNIDIE